MSSHRVDWILTTRRQAAEEAARQVEEKLLQKDASYREASRELKQTGAKLALARVGGADTKELEMRMRKWEKIKAERLRKNGLTEADLLPRYTCPVCRDTGRKPGGGDCDCKRQLALEQLFEEDPSAKMLKEETFATFDLSLFRDTKQGEEPESPRSMMRTMRREALAFTENFAREGDRNWLLYGPVGSGKSFLCHAIARDMMDKGIPVVYQTAYGMQELFQSVRFAQAKDRAEREGALKRLMEADLLVIDDLGTETVHSVSVAHFFELLNDRLLEKKSTIISTNLEPPEIERIYSPRIFSRLFGQYEMYNIFGDDLRLRV
ncbi:MAG: ATP-binding protein [Tissierellia bacterium]|jgi:DNA replication protein DnaC|nr:ATP-binding protein [Bacillota bacterium]NLK59306.1 ATP-binding protein [Tissierellia bacterium]